MPLKGCGRFSFHLIHETYHHWMPGNRICDAGRYVCAKSTKYSYSSFNPLPVRIFGKYFSTLDSRVLDCLGAEK